MRSRYAAFALKEVDYLWRTLHRDHRDRARLAEDVLRELRDACSANRYMGLRILETEEADAHGVARVMFAARVFRKGCDLSFVERSEFLHDGEGWRYLRGDAARE
jgi:SEC-C motif domain protein